MVPVYEIRPGTLDPSDTNMVCEVGPSSLVLYLENESTRLIDGLSIYQASDFGMMYSKGTLVSLIEQCGINRAFKSVRICYSGPEFILVPESVFDPSGSDKLLNKIYGDIGDFEVLTDHMQASAKNTIHRIPHHLHHTLTQLFPAATFIHLSTILESGKRGGDDLLKVIFSKQLMLVKLTKNGETHFLQALKYDTSEDAVYQLLNVCMQFERKEIELLMGGMIEKASALFKEIKKYFISARICEANSISLSEELQKTPLHYFSHLFSISECV